MFIPTIQTDSIEDFQTKLDTYNTIKNPNKPTHIQVDINDGIFSDDFSVQPCDLRQINWHGMTHEYHLLVDNPDEYLGDVVETGATTIIGHIEHLHDRQNFIDTAKQLKLKVGLALDLYTPVEELTDTELNDIDLVLLMAYKAGHSGPVLNPLIFEKIKELRDRGFQKTIEIDGGINATNSADLIKAGATHLAVNSSLWHNGEVEANLKLLLGNHAQNP